MGRPFRYSGEDLFINWVLLNINLEILIDDLEGLMGRHLRGDFLPALINKEIETRTAT